MVFGNFVNQSFQAGGVDVNITNFLLLLGIGDAGNKLFADFSDQTFRNLIHNLGKALDGITYSLR